MSTIRRGLSQAMLGKDISTSPYQNRLPVTPSHFKRGIIMMCALWKNDFSFVAGCSPRAGSSRSNIVCKVALTGFCLYSRELLLMVKKYASECFGMRLYGLIRIWFLISNNSCSSLLVLLDKIPKSRLSHTKMSANRQKTLRVPIDVITGI